MDVGLTREFGLSFLVTRWGVGNGDGERDLWVAVKVSLSGGTGLLKNLFLGETSD